MLRQLQLNGLKYGAIMVTNLQNQLAYVWDALSRAFMILFFMLIFVHLWTAVYQQEGSAEIAGLTLANTIWYFLLAETMELGRVRHDVQITAEVKDGSIAYTLVRPYNYLAYHFFNGFGESVVRMLLVFLLGAPIAIYYAGAPTLDWRHLPAVLLIIILAGVLDFFFTSMIGLLAFLTEETFSFRLIYSKITFILGGLLIPLDFLPAWLQPVARALPFNLMTYAPAKLFVAFDVAQFWQMIRLHLIWLPLLGLLLTAQFRWATRRLAVNGG